MQRAAGIAVEIEGIAQIAPRHPPGIVEPSAAKEMLAPAGVALHLAACQAEETLGAVFSIGAGMTEGVDMLDEMVAVEGGGGDELGVLQVDGVLLIVAFGGELAVGENGKLPGPVGAVGNLHPPDLVSGAKGHIVQYPAGDACVHAFHLGIAGAVAGYGVEVMKGLFHRPPRGRPVVAVFIVPQVHIAAGLVKLVEGIAQDTACRAGLDKAVAAGILGDDGAVFRRAEVVGPGHGRAGVGDDVLPRRIVKITVLHGVFLLFHDRNRFSPKVKTSRDSTDGSAFIVSQARKRNKTGGAGKKFLFSVDTRRYLLYNHDIAGKRGAGGVPERMKQMIADTYAALLQKKPLDKITVKELVEACQISRQTFYYHFSDVLEVLTWRVSQSVQQAVARSLEAETPEAAMEELLRMALRDRPMIRRIFQSQRRDQIEGIFLDGVRHYMEELIRNKAPGLPMNYTQGRVCLRYCAGGVAGLMLGDYVTEDNLKPMAEQLSRMVSATVRSCLQE